MYVCIICIIFSVSIFIQEEEDQLTAALLHSPDYTDFLKVPFLWSYLASDVFSDVNSVLPLHSTLQTHRKLNFTSIAKAVVDLVPISGEVLVEILQTKEPTGSMRVVGAFVVEEKVKDISAEVDSNVAAPVQAHLQTFVYSSQERRCAVQNISY